MLFCRHATERGGARDGCAVRARPLPARARAQIPRVDAGRAAARADLFRGAVNGMFCWEFLAKIILYTYVVMYKYFCANFQEEEMAMQRGWREDAGKLTFIILDKHTFDTTQGDEVT